ncbi:hypothetical protein FKM82_007916 [Ascaphus truei]
MSCLARTHSEPSFQTRSEESEFLKAVSKSQVLSSFVKVRWSLMDMGRAFPDSLYLRGMTSLSNETTHWRLRGNVRKCYLTERRGGLGCRGYCSKENQICLG